MNKPGGNRFEILLEFLALSETIKRLKGLEVPADVLTWHRFFGALLIVLLVLLFLSGAFMAFYYSPAPGFAYDSVDFALYSVPFGAIIKGIHHYGWNLFLIVLGLHLIRAFLVGAYKPPRQLVWISGVMILLLVPAFIITGDLLPWDQKGYWSTQVRISIIDSIPIFGDMIIRLLQGGPLTGIVALTRFYVLHILFLPLFIILLIILHIHLLRHRGITQASSGFQSAAKTISFFPQLVNRWLILFLLVTLALGLISWYWPAALGDPADPTDSTFVPKPEWWVLFLNQLVTLFKGRLAVIGSVIIPVALIGLLIALPFMDSSPERHFSNRKIVMLVAAGITFALLVLSILGYLEHFGDIHP